MKESINPLRQRACVPQVENHCSSLTFPAFFHLVNCVLQKVLPRGVEAERCFQFTQRWQSTGACGYGGDRAQLQKVTPGGGTSPEEAGG